MTPGALGKSKRHDVSALVGQMRHVTPGTSCCMEHVQLNATWRLFPLQVHWLSDE